VDTDGSNVSKNPVKPHKPIEVDANGRVFMEGKNSELVLCPRKWITASKHCGKKKQGYNLTGTLMVQKVSSFGLKPTN